MSTTKQMTAIAKELLYALREAEVGLTFAGADQKIPKGAFVPTPTLALRNVRAAIDKVRVARWAKAVMKDPVDDSE